MYTSKYSNHLLPVSLPYHRIQRASKKLKNIIVRASLKYDCKNPQESLQRRVQEGARGRRDARYVMRELNRINSNASSPGSIAQVLVRIFELRIANVCEAILLPLVPPVPQLALPLERLRALHLGLHQLGDDVPGVHVNRTDGHDFLPLLLGQLSDQQRDQRAQLRDLLLQVVLDGVVVALLEAREGHVDLGGPPDLRPAQGHLSRIIEQPLLARFLLVAHHRLAEVMPDGRAHGVLKTIQPGLHSTLADHPAIGELDVFAVLGEHSFA